MRLFGVVVAALLGCKGGRPEPAPVPAAPDAAVSAVEVRSLEVPADQPLVAGGAPIETHARARARCESVLPADVRAGLTVEGAVVGGHMTCNLYRGKTMVGSVTADCARGTTMEDFQNRLPRVKLKQVAGLGRGAWRASSIMGFTWFYDADVDCECRASAFKKGIDDLALARGFETGLTAETAPRPPPPPPGEAKLQCDELVPPALRDRLKLAKRVDQTASFGKVRCAYSGKGTLYVELDCKASPRSAAERLESARRWQKTLQRFKADAELGKGAFLEEGNKMTFIDPETDCLVSTWLVKRKKPKVQEIARDVEQAVTKEAIGRSEAVP
jgi:hypothetical protein